ncbi:MAG: hypothetical protein BJ554DRAFT_6902, partial [Olpidium bornovanus]
PLLQLAGGAGGRRWIGGRNRWLSFGGGGLSSSGRGLFGSYRGPAQAVADNARQDSGCGAVCPRGELAGPVARLPEHRAVRLVVKVAGGKVRNWRTGTATSLFPLFSVKGRSSPAALRDTPPQAGSRSACGPRPDRPFLTLIGQLNTRAPSGTAPARRPTARRVRFHSSFQPVRLVRLTADDAQNSITTFITKCPKAIVLFDQLEKLAEDALISVHYVDHGVDVDKIVSRFRKQCDAESVEIDATAGGNQRFEFQRKDHPQIVLVRSEGNWQLADIGRRLRAGLLPGATQKPSDSRRNHTADKVAKDVIAAVEYAVADDYSVVLTASRATPPAIAVSGQTRDHSPAAAPLQAAKTL